MQVNGWNFEDENTVERTSRHWCSGIWEQVKISKGGLQLSLKKGFKVKLEYAYQLRTYRKVSATFLGFGHAKLIFGNCAVSSGTKVQAYFNGVDIAECIRGFTEVSFNYTAGDILSLTSSKHGIIQLKSLQIVCNGK